VEQNGIFISYDKRKELANAIQRIVIEQYISIHELLEKYINALLNLPELLYPLLPKNKKVPLSTHYILSDRIRSVHIDNGVTYEITSEEEYRVLYSYNDEIANAVEKYNSAKAKIIREIPSFDWCEWNDDVIKLNYGELKYHTFSNNGFADVNVMMDYIPYERSQCALLSEFLGKCINEYEPKEISRVRYHYDHRHSSPALYIYGIRKNSSETRDSEIYSAGRFYNDWKIYEVSLELYPMADELIKIFKDMENGLNEYKKKFERSMKRLEDINTVHEFKETVGKFKK